MPAHTIPDATWLAIRVQAMLHCKHTLVELVEEIQQAGGEPAQRLTSAWLDAFAGTGIVMQRGLDTLHELLANQAVIRATGEYHRQALEAA